MTGETVTHYHVLEKLGGGGMGVVYKARDLRLDRLVALKFLPPELTRDDDAKRRFMQEARTASALDHPHICTIYDIDETTDGQVFFAMALYDGETLKKRVDRGPMPVLEAVGLVQQIADGLARAHESGIVHRDIKPANVMLTRDGLIKILDFGLAKLQGQTALTRTGTTVGTVAYMAPEQVSGQMTDARADIWALGVMLYELLTGQRPFRGDHDAAVLNAILTDTPQPLETLCPDAPPDLRRIVTRALSKNPASRYQSAREMLGDITACAHAIEERRATPRPAASIGSFLRRPAIAIPAAVLLLAAAGLAGMAIARNRRVVWAHTVAVRDIQQLTNEDQTERAFALASEAEQYIPGDPILEALTAQVSWRIAGLTTSPPGATISSKPFGAPDSEWRVMGVSPISGVRIPRTVLQWKVEHQGYETQVLAIPTFPLSFPFDIKLDAVGSVPPGMVSVVGGSFGVPLTGFDLDDVVQLAPFSIDQFEVTNRQFKEFVDAQGYDKEEYWTELAADQPGRAWKETIGRFVDSTGKPGPAIWELGTFTTGRGDYPVGGVSWYEAAAYARFRHKSLPTIYHWSRASLTSVLSPYVVPRSNFSGNGPEAVGTKQSMGPFNTYDMAGNVREWCWNTSGANRWILGGGWSDPDYMFSVPYELPPLDRAPQNGFRLADYRGQSITAELLAPIQKLARDHRRSPAVDDAVYEAFKRRFAYARTETSFKTESRVDSNPDWIRETVSFSLPYTKQRIKALLFLPKRANSPFQTVVFFTGLGQFLSGPSSDTIQLDILDFIVRDGRAVVMPIFEGAYERRDGFLDLTGEAYQTAFLEHMIHWRQELGATIDYLSTRSEFDVDHLTYLGLSFGGSTALPVMVLEPRVKVAVLLSGGFTYRNLPPEADEVNYVTRFTKPVLMVNGAYDNIFPVEAAQKPLFDRFATSHQEKRHVVLPTNHIVWGETRGQMISEVLAWLDRHLGPVN